MLHNSGAPVKNASVYRTLLQNHLPEIIQSLSEWRRGIIGRLTAGQVDERVMQLFSVWENWAIFPPQYLCGLEAIFCRTEADYNRYIDLYPNNTIDATMLGDIELLRRNAKACGIATFLETLSNGKIYENETHDVDPITLYRNLQYVRDFMSKKTASVIGSDVSFEEGATILGLSGVSGSAAVGQLDDIDGVPLNMIETADGMDIDGVPLDDIDGVPLDDIDGFPIDGVPLGSDSDSSVSRSPSRSSSYSRSRSRSSSRSE
jgi:U2-associated protein SR140